MSKKTLAKYWWALVIRGIAAILFAVLAIFWTKSALEILVLFFGIFVLIEGFITMISSFFASKEDSNWWLYLTRGLIAVAIGLITLFWPGITLFVFVYLIAIWAIFMGLIELWLSSKIDNSIGIKWMLTTVGILSLLIGIIILFFPYSSIMTITILVGIFALISGISMVIFGLQIRKL